MANGILLVSNLLIVVSILWEGALSAPVSDVDKLKYANAREKENDEMEAQQLRSKASSEVTEALKGHDSGSVQNTSSGLTFKAMQAAQDEEIRLIMEELDARLTQENARHHHAVALLKRNIMKKVKKIELSKIAARTSITEDQDQAMNRGRRKEMSRFKKASTSFKHKLNKIVDRAHRKRTQISVATAKQQQVALKVKDPAQESSKSKIQKQIVATKFQTAMLNIMKSRSLAELHMRTPIVWPTAPAYRCEFVSPP